jgi:ABC-type transport system substrate-binding protein
MFSKRSGFLYLALAAIALLAIAGCQPSERVVEVTRVVEVPGAEVQVTAPPAGEEGPLAAEGMVPCQPLPEMAFGVGASPHVASLATTSQVPESRFGAPQARPAQQATGKVYRVGVFEDVTTTNYWAANGPDNTVWNAYMLPQRLTAYTLADKRYDFVPQVATALPEPLVQEGDFWTVEIPFRTDITWSDGTPFGAADWAFTADTVKKLGLISGNWQSFYDFTYLDHIEAVDTYTAKLFFHTKPGLARYQYGVLGSPILSKAYWEPVVAAAAAPIDALPADAADDAVLAAQQEAQDNLFAHVPEGEPLAGSFDFGKWEAGAFLENSASPDYYNEGVTVREYANGAYQEDPGFVLYGPAEGDVELELVVGPHVDSVVYSIYGSQDAAILALQNGDVDAVLNPLGMQRGLVSRVRGDPNITVLENPTNGFRYMSFNNRRRPMNDCAFRQAVAVLIDKEFVTGTILQGVAFPLYTFVPEANGAWYFEDVPKLGQGLDRAQRTELAKAILKQAGYSWEGGVEPVYNEDNLRVEPAGRLIMPDGVPVPPLAMPAPSAGYDPLRSTFAIWIESWLNEFGIPLKAELAGFNVIIPIIYTEQDFDMYILGWSLSIFPSYLNDFFAEAQAVPDGNNAGGYVNPEFETLAAQLLTCDSVEACKPIADQIQTLLSTEVPYVVLFDTGIIEPYRSAAVDFPYTENLSGLQYAHQGPAAGMQAEVNVR